MWICKHIIVYIKESLNVIGMFRSAFHDTKLEKKLLRLFFFLFKNQMVNSAEIYTKM